jgi:hypothetical protein
MDVMDEMGLEALQVALGWLREAETAYAVGHGRGVAELIRRHRASLESLPLLLPDSGVRIGLPVG